MKEKPKLKEEDYFKYIKTFKIWLKVKKNKKLEDLDKKKTQKKFKKFIKKWNSNKLKEIFYNQEELTKKYGDAIEHKWNFKNEDIVKQDSDSFYKELNEIQKSQQKVQPKEEKQVQDDTRKLGPKMPDFQEKQKIAQSKYEVEKNLMLLHDVSADNTYRWDNFNMKREDRRMVQKVQQLNDINSKIKAHQQKEDEKLKQILETVNFSNKFQKQL